MNAYGFKRGGVYLVAGGAGGLGRTLSLYLARNYGAKLAWLGRRAEDAEIAAGRAEVVAAGGEVLYLRADLLRGSEVSAAAKDVVRVWGRIDGVVHSAIVLRDRSLERMREEDFLASLDPKTDGTVNLARAAAHTGAGWLLVFSSIVSFFNGAGQSNYNAGSVFTDAYARWTERKFGLPVRVLNWGYWGEVGVVASERYRSEMAARGIGSISGDEGMAAVERVLAGDASQVVFIKATERALEDMGFGIDRQDVSAERSGFSVSALQRELENSRDAILATDDRAISRQLRGFHRLDELAVASLGAILRRAGALEPTGARLDIDRARAALAVLPRFERLLTAVSELANTSSTSLREDVATLKAELLQEHSDLEGAVELLQACTEGLPEVLSGRRAGTDVVFPGGSLRLVERIYRGTAISDHFNQMMAWSIARTVARTLAGSPAGVKIRVLEIGAGTGSTTEFVAEALRPYADRVEYVFSDVSAGFRRQFDRSFAARYPFMNFAVVDLDRGLDEQGLEAGRFHVVLAANALHVAKNLHHGLQLIKRLLVPQGLLALIEVDRVLAFNSLTYGLLDGWWHADDASRRLPDSPLLSREGWLRVLAEEGFVGAGSAERWRGETHAYPQTLLIAESDGRLASVESAQIDASVVPLKPTSGTLPLSQGTNGAHAHDLVQSGHGTNGRNGTHSAIGSTPTPASEAQVGAKVREILMRQFRLDAADLTEDTAFDRLGVDSIVAVEVVETLNRELRIELRSVDLFNYPTFGSLVQRIVEVHKPVVADMAKSAAEVKSQPPAVPEPKPEPVPKVARTGSIAVVGLSLRVPGARNAEEFWRNLAAGRDSVHEVSSQRWGGEDYFSVDRRRTDRSYSRHAGLLDDIAGFDPLFFNISGHEAELMDPQQRLFLMEAWKALEDAGLPQQKVSGVKCGVFAGSSFGDYDRVLQAGGRDTESFAFTGTAPAILPSRIAYWLNLKGPTFAVDTACSSSGVAVHLACESLQLGTSDLAIAGGVSTLSTPRFHVLASQTGMLSETGRCRAFGAGADGFVPAEGVVALVLKRLEDAERDGDRIHGVILGSAINQDGRTMGITAPNGPSQTALETGLYRKLDINPESIGLVECHGTGTKLGDPIEIGALTEAFRPWTNQKQFCAIGSVKSNIGHSLIAAAGVSLVKALLALRHRQLPPTLHCTPANPQLGFAETPFYPNAELREWRGGGQPRRVAVSSFGFSGTNAHFVLEEAPVRTAAGSAAQPWLFTLSAKVDVSLRQRASELAAWLEQAEGQAADLSALAWTLGAGRTQFDRRLAIVAETKAELVATLRAWLGGAALENIRVSAPAKGRSAASAYAESAPCAREAWLRAADHYAAGYALNWDQLIPAKARAIVSAPTYAFALERYWVEPRQSATPAVASVPAPATPLKDALVFVPEWRATPTVSARSLTGRWLVIGDDGWVAQGLRARGPQTSVTALAVSEALAVFATGGFASGVPDGIVFRFLSAPLSLAEGLREGIESVHAVMRAVMLAKPTREVRFFVVTPPNPPPEWAALAAYLEVATQEQPRVRVRWIDAAACDEALFAEFGAGDDYREIRLVEGSRSVKTLIAAPTSSVEQGRFRPGGTCLITGGAGGLGWVFSQYLARTYRSRIVWLGRSSESETIRRRIAEIAALGGDAVYVQADITRADEAARAVSLARSHFGPVHAVIHAAGVFKNRFILQKEVAELREVLVPKTHGIVNMDTALAGEPLDAMILCSSVASAVPEAGQGDYAFANRFLDEFAACRERLRLKGLRSGRTVSINWQMWRDGGMMAGRGTDHAAAEEHARETERVSGLPALSRDEGTALLERALVEGSTSSGLFGRGDARVLQARADLIYGFATTDVKPAVTPPVNSARSDTADLQPRVLTYVRTLLAEVLKISSDRLDETTAFTEYGVDSILVLKFNARLAQDLPDASKTLLFEFPNMAALGDHLAAAHGPALESLLGGGATTEAAPAVSLPAPTSATPAPSLVPADDEIAIIGVAGRFPGAEDIDAFWANLLAGRDCVVPVPRERWDADALFDATQGAPGKSYCKWGGFVAGVGEFDAPFFNIPPVEAELMDPQQRLFLQASWHALENAGYARSQLAKSRLGDGQFNIGVFAGVTHNAYQIEGVLRNEAAPTRVDHSGEWSLANRVSYFFNFSGPSLPVDTACSASLSAVHLACESLRRGECAAALAGGVNLHVHPVKYVNASSLGMLSPTGKCRTFGDGADGYVPGEGVGVLVLKPLRAAQRDGDHIHGVIKATAVNHGGRTNGFSVPNPAAQAAVVTTALQKGGIDPRTITCLEAHGTGTELGDPIEVDGLTRAFCAEASSAPWCSLGSVKSNIGHLEAAAGIAGIVKVLLQMKHRTLAPTLHAAKANPHIDFTRGPFVVQHAAADWLRPVVDGREWPRRAGVSSFGAGGSNAHIILEEPPVSLSSDTVAQPELIVLSARTEPALRAAAELLRVWLTKAGQGASAPALSDLAYTLQVAREAMSERLALVAASLGELSERLATWLRGDAASVWRGRVSRSTTSVTASATAVELAQAWVAGAEIDWLSRAPGDKAMHRIVPLPGYAFERKRYWYGSFGHAAKPSTPAQSAPIQSMPQPLRVSHWRDAGLAFSAHPEVTLEIDADGIALVRMQDRTHRNMFTPAVLEGLMHCFAAIDADDSVKAVIVTGIDNVFAMGGTREELLTLSEQVRTFASLEFIFKGFLQCRVPVIAAIQGHAQGGGLVFGLYADVVVMAEEGLYSAVFTKYGFTPGLGATFILGDKLGDGLATEMMMTAATYRGSELQQRGAGVTFRPAAEVISTALGIAREMAQKPGTTLRTLKQGLAQRKLERLPAVIAEEVRMHGETFGQAEVKERIRHYIREETEASEATKKVQQPMAASVVPTPAPNQMLPAPTASVPALAKVRATLRDNLCEKLHLDAATFDGQQPFRDLGLDSILGVEFIHGINRAFSLRLDASIVYDFVNLDALSEHIAKLLGAQTGASSTAPAVAEPPPPAKSVAAAPLKLSTPMALRAEKAARTPGPIKLAALAVPRDRVASSPVVEARDTSDHIAVIGMACRLPGARDLAAFWRNLASGVDSVIEVPAERWDVDAFYSSDPTAEGRSYCRKGGFIDEVDRFDPLFFNLSHAEAEVMDPQQRLFLEEAWRALEHAGYEGRELSGVNCGVFVGAGTGDYGAIVRRANPALAQSAFAGMGLTPSILAARISYFLNLKGPSVAIDTACSSSLVALHQACRSIQAGDCTMALVGGVSLILEPDQLVTTSKLQMLSPRGQCRPFDDGADGIALSEGVAVVVLKSLKAAVADGDRVLGVIRASGINQDGKTNGITAPSAVSQADLERAVYRRAEVNPADFGMVEAHGTGTLLGDPVEVRGLTEAFRTFTEKTGYCALGSVKSNIGHTSFAAGIAGVIKTLLCFEHGQIPPSLNFATPNRHIDFAGSPFFVNTALRAWPATTGRTRLAAVSSFGYSGTNAHVVLSDFVAEPGVVKRSALVPRRFARDRCWLDAPAVPLRQEPTETSGGICLAADDVRVREHCVRGERWIAGSALLERALAAVQSSGRALNLTWRRPLVAQPASDVSLRVAIDGANLHVLSGDQNYAEGRLVATAGLADRRQDITALQTLSGEVTSAEKFYAAMSAGGLDYGPSYRLIERVTSTATQAVSLIKRPVGVAADAAFSLVLEALLQTPAVLSRGAAVPQDVRDVVTAPPAQVLAGQRWLGHAERVDQDAATETYRLTLLAEDGRELARIGEFVVRTLPATASAAVDEIVYLKTEWPAVPLVGSRALRGSVLVLDDTAEFAAKLQAAAPEALVTWVAVGTINFAPVLADAKPEVIIHHGLRGGETRELAVERGLMALLRISQALLQAGLTRSVRGLCVLPEDSAAGNSMGAVAKTIAQEQPALCWKVVSGVGELSTLMLEAASDDDAVEVRYRGAQRMIARSVEFTPSLRLELPLRRGGTYFITGGAGGLGLIFARELIHRWHANVVLFGRSAPEAVIARLRSALGDESRWLYCAGDVARKTDVAKAMAEARARFGGVRGVLHAAGVLEDGFLLKKDLASVGRVLSPKIEGVHALDAVTAEEPLEFFACFSSLAGLLGNVGQCDYAFANAYLDAFSREREQRRALGERFGRSVSIQWPLWSAGGMGVAADVLSMRAEGVRALDATNGMRIFEAALRSGEPVLAGGLRPPVVAQKVAGPIARVSDGTQLAPERVLHFVKTRFAELTKIPAERLDGAAPLERYGIDSLLVLSFTRLLEKDFGPLSKSLLFEHQTLAALAQHFAERHPARLEELIGGEEQLSAKGESVRTVTGSAAAETIAAATKEAAEPVDGIAIIGLAGRYPGAENIDAFWRNLAAGRDCISEVPADRWQLEKVTGVRGEPGKTYNRWGGFLSGVDRFDAGFFRIPPREAESMDPQERLFLETAWHAVEDAGYARPELRGRAVGVFAGVMYSQYQLLGIARSTEDRWLTLSASYATIANRVSYFFDWHGPSMAVDTMCSSSLTAIHLACDSLRKGESELALAGGVNLSLHPAKDVGLAQGGFAASDGRCKSFGSGGDGYVPGEGVGAVLLKPLARAVTDGDHVYGVIRASAINHGGKTNGYTVPNPKAQSAVVRTALRAAGVEPRTISYVEAHGTGTALGDPIEIAALTQVWTEPAVGSSLDHRCALGSVKSNIGHLESAAGIAGLTKVLLQLRHRQLAPSLHSATLNPHIDFGSTPFVVQQSAAPWLALGEAGAVPLRRAGISSFGAGGANAHLVVEEFAPVPAEPVATGARQLLVLSAVTRERLTELACAWRTWISDTRISGLPALADAAFTLQVGRESFDERLAFTATTWDEVEIRLAAFVEGRGDDNWQAGSARAARVGVATLVEGAESHEFVAGLVRARNLSGLARWWIAGAEVEWRGLWVDLHARRVSLPSYRFASERHWVPEVSWIAARSTVSTVGPHPLLTENISTLSGVEFVTRLAADNPLLRDHTVGGRAMLPGAASLELVMAAARLALGAESVSLTQITWLRPLAVQGGPLELHTRVAAKPDGRVGIEGYLDGELCVSASALRMDVAAPESVPLEALRARCVRQLDVGLHYSEFGAAGLVYGPAYRTISESWAGAGEVFSRLALAGDDLVSGYRLHPALVDGAFQSLAALATSDGPGLPFAIKRVTACRALPARCWAHGRAHTTESGATLFDLTLLADDGAVAATIEGLATRRAGPDAPAEGLLHRRVWVDASLSASRKELPKTLLLLDERTELETALMARGFAVRRVIPGETFWTAGNVTAVRPESTEDIVRLIGEAKPEAVIHAWGLTAKSPEVFFARGVASVHLLTQALAKLGSRSSVRCLYLHPDSVPEFSAVAAYAKTARAEHPAIAWRTIGLADLPSALDGIVVQELADGGSAIEVHHAPTGARRAATMEQLVADGSSPASRGSWAHNGVMLISGGAGGLGLLVAGHVVRAGGRVMLAGRSELTTEKRAAISAFGDAAAYVQADVSELAGACAAVAATKTRFGRITGVLHAAGGLRDGLIWKKTLEDFRTVLKPKAAGAAALDEATREESLDWFIVFSSTAGLFGSAGQADYAFANALLDAWSHRREVLRTRGERSGRTVTINWPLWADGGMGGAAGAAKAAAFGLEVLDADSGLALLDRALSCGEVQVFACKARRATLRAQLLADTTGTEHRVEGRTVTQEIPVRATTAPAAIVTKSAVVAHLVRVFCELTKLPDTQVHADEPIENYGLDSIMVTTFAQMLERDLGELSKTLLFEYSTLDTLADYLLGAHADALARVCNPVRAAEIQVSTAPVYAKEAAGEPAAIAPKTTLPPVDDPIAIIGMAGRYPQADTLAEFWANLAAGRDCIEPVPEERWRVADYFDPTPMTPGRTSNRWGGFLRGVELFDPLFFNLSPREGQFMDPQERLFLETVYHTLEDAGCTRTELSDRKVGVFVGVMYGQYQLLGVEERLQGNPVSVSSSFATIANRVSYFFNWRGPSLALDTMCSASLTSLHLACESIRRGECELAVAGGVNVTIHPEKDLILSQTGFSTRDGRCRAFGAGGEGYVPGEGVGAVLLKPLSRAIADGDRIQGVVRASAINHGGHTNGYTVPNSRSQADVVGEALAKSGIDPSSITYIEAHGTGTSLGDPIEVSGLQAAFARAGRAAGGAHCALGSVKSNIGHCESAAGIASITKVLLQFQHGKIAPSLHAKELNPNIKFSDTCFRVQRELGAWPRLPHEGRMLPRRAGVSSFGAGGANAHLVLEEYLVPTPPADTEKDHYEGRPVLLILSAKNEARLRELAGSVARFLAVRIDPASNGDGVPVEARARYLGEVAWTLQAGREPLEERAAWLVRDLADAVAQLGQWARSGGSATVQGNAKRPTDEIQRLRDTGTETAVVAQHISSGDLLGLARLWVAGARVEWRAMWGAQHSARVALPGYPFARLRCWVPGRDERLAEGKVSAPISLADQTTYVVPKPTELGLSIMFFSDSSQVEPGRRYDLVLEAARFADRHGFEAVWTPERHFHPFGGIYSSPATLMGALAATTRRIRLRAGSVVLPLEDPLRVAEAWSVVDNLSGGRVDLGFASGWNPNDFALAPESYSKLRDVWLRRIPEVQRLWRGEELERLNGKGEQVKLRIYPQPCQKELPVWLTASRRVESFEDAGRGGYNVLTMLQGSTVEQLAEKIVRYRAARRVAGFDPATGRVTLMLHTFVDADEKRARELVRKPFTEYIRSSLDAHMTAVEGGKAMSADDLQKMAEYSYERYCRHASLIGSPESCMVMVRAARAAGVDEIACLLDFGAENAAILTALPQLAALRLRIEAEMARREAESPPVTPVSGAAAVVPVSEKISGRYLLREWTESAAGADSAPKAPTILLVSPEAGEWESALAAVHPESNIRRIVVGGGLGPVAADEWDVALRRGPKPDRIYFVAESLPADGHDEYMRTSAAQESGPIAIHRLVQALVRLEWLKSGLSLRVVTHDAFTVEQGATVTPYHAGLAGMAAALAKEFPVVDVATLDVSSAECATVEGCRGVMAQVAAEPAQRASEKIALRRGRRWRAGLRLEKDLAPTLQPVRFRREGVYLIVGGAGQVGLALSRYLARNYAARLVWVGRRAQDAGICEAVAEIERLGGAVEYVSARSEDLASMQAAVDRTYERFGVLHGALHAALVFQDERLGNLSEAECRAVLDAKTRGSAALFEAVRNRELDFLLFLGSAQSLFTEARRGAYAAACCFQDAFVMHVRAAAQFPVQVINWGFWQHGVSAEFLPAIAQAGLGAIEPADGITAIEAILASGVSQVAYLKASDEALTRMGATNIARQAPREKSPTVTPTLDERIAALLFN